MVDQQRAQRVGKRIGQIVATTLEHEIKDPRVDFVTVTDVRLTGDLRDATVYYTVLNPNLDEQPDYDTVQAGLDKARGQIRSIVGQGLGIRHTPSITFVRDTLGESASSLEAALEKARQEDKKLEEQATTAQYAGDPDPYK